MGWFVAVHMWDIIFLYKAPRELIVCFKYFRRGRDYWIILFNRISLISLSISFIHPSSKHKRKRTIYSFYYIVVNVL